MSIYDTSILCICIFNIHLCYYFSDSSDKTKSRAYLLKKKVLPRWDSSRGKIKLPTRQNFWKMIIQLLIEMPK